MLRLLTRTLRRRAGLLLAVGYLACAIVPSAAAALGGGGCLADHRHVAAAVHDHAGGQAPHQAPQAPGQKQADSDGTSIPGNCCSATCLSAIAEEPRISIGVTTCARVILPALEAARGGLGPDRLDRPPDLLLSI